MSPLQQTELIDRIVEADAMRRRYMRFRIGFMNALGAHLRLVNGWDLGLPKAGREKIAKAVSRMIESGDAGAESAMVADAKKACEPFGDKEEEYDREMEKLAVRLAIWDAFGKPILGFGPRQLAWIVGAAGDLGNYPERRPERLAEYRAPKHGDAALWKRLGVAVIDGVRQGNLRKGASADDWVRHSYSRERRSIMWNIGDLIIRAQVRKVKDADGNDTGERVARGRYGEIYLARKQLEIEKAQARGLEVRPAAKIPKGMADRFCKEIVIHRRAQRFMEKRLLRDLWRAWRRANLTVSETTCHQLPAAEIHPANIAREQDGRVEA